MILLLLLISLFTSGCANWIVKQTVVDKALLECADAPPIPAGVVTNRQDAQYKNDLKYAFDDCKSKLDKVKAIQEQVKASAMDSLLGQ